MVTRTSATSAAIRAKLLISPDRFIRTTDADHTLAAQEMIRRSFAAGDIYVGSYGNSTVTVLSPDGTILDTIAVSGPAGIAIAP
jgi:hypothetical protein